MIREHYVEIKAEIRFFQATLRLLAFYAIMYLVAGWEGKLDLFSGCATQIGADFRWSVAVFKAQGAVEAIKRANQVPLRTYYPFRIDRNGNFRPLWRNYLFLEFHKTLTMQVCRSTRNFIKMLTMRDEEGETYPILVPKRAIDENMRLLRLGKFDDKTFLRSFYGRGSLVRVTEGTFQDKRVRLEMDILPQMPGNTRVSININGFKASIELWKLSL
jgi:hypothetical protein